jgi:hypothetical protein
MLVQGLFKMFELYKDVATAVCCDEKVAPAGIT